MAEATRRRDWLRAGPRMAAHPGRLVDYAQYRTQVRRIVWGHVIVRAEGDDRVRSATIAEAGPDWAPSGAERTFEVDAVCTAYGFLPPSIWRARSAASWRRRRRPRRGHARPPSPGVFVAGEASGIGGADLALVEGELAGYAAAAPRQRPGGDGRRPRDLAAAARAPRAKLAGFARHPRRPLRPAARPARARRRRTRPVPLRGRHRRRGRRGGRRRRDHDVGAEGRHPLWPGPVPGPRLRAARLRPAAGARALQRPGSDPADSARVL